MFYMRGFFLTCYSLFLIYQKQFSFGGFILINKLKKKNLYKKNFLLWKNKGEWELLTLFRFLFLATEWSSIHLPTAIQPTKSTYCSPMQSDFMKALNNHLTVLIDQKMASLMLNKVGVRMKINFYFYFLVFQNPLVRP